RLRPDLLQAAEGESESGLRWEVGVRQVQEPVWLVTFMHDDLGYFDDETCRPEPIRIPSARKCYPCAQNDGHSCDRNRPAEIGVPSRTRRSVRGAGGRLVRR